MRVGHRPAAVARGDLLGREHAQADHLRRVRERNDERPVDLLAAPKPGEERLGGLQPESADLGEVRLDVVGADQAPLAPADVGLLGQEAVEPPERAQEHLARLARAAPIAGREELAYPRAA